MGKVGRRELARRRAEVAAMLIALPHPCVWCDAARQRAGSAFCSEECQRASEARRGDDRA